MGVAVGLFVAIIAVYFIIQQRLNKGDTKRIRQLREGTKEKSFSSEVMYQKLYMFYKNIPFVKRYILKLRRKLEIINIEDEYLTRKQSAKIITNALAIVLPLTILIIMLTRTRLAATIYTVAI
jgi:hypothetical protein